MARCEQCGAEFSNWFGDLKRTCPKCERREAQQPQVLPPGSPVPAAPMPVLPVPLITWTFLALNIGVFAAMAISSREFMGFSGPVLLYWGADFPLLTAHGQWWRMLTATFLHGGLLHIAVNMWALRNLGYTAELFYGRKNFTLIYLVSGLGGSAGTMLWSPFRMSVGASGALFGVAGALAALVYVKKLPIDRALLRRDLGSIGVMIAFNLLIAAKLPIMDNAAHVGGLLAGFVLGFVMPARVFRLEREKSQAPGYMAAVMILGAIAAIGVYTKQRTAGDIEAYWAADASDANDRTSALSHADRAAKLHPISASGNFEIGVVYLRAGEKEKALPFLRKASAMEPDNRNFKSALAIAEQSDGK